MKLQLKKLMAAAAIALTAVFAFGPARAFAKDDPAKEIKSAQVGLDTFKKTDPGLTKVLSTAQGYAIFSNVGKGGFVVGGAHGDGVLYERGLPTGKVTLSQVTVGAQVGGQEFSELIIFKDQQALNDFKAGTMAFQGSVSAVAASAGASENIKYQKGVAVMTLAKGGLMAEAALGGQKFSFEPYETVPKT